MTLEENPNKNKAVFIFNTRIMNLLLNLWTILKVNFYSIEIKSLVDLY